MNSEKNKTWARETSVILLLFLGTLAYQQKTEELRVLAIPFTTFALAAFSLKQPAVVDRLRK